MTRLAVVLMLIGAVTLSAQTTLVLKPEVTENPYPASTLYEFKNVDPGRVLELFNLVRDLLSPSIAMKMAMNGKIAIIRGKNQADVDKAVEVLKRYDVLPPPRPTFQFTAYVVRANASSLPSSSAAPTSGGEHKDAATGAGSLPPELASAITEMKRTFAYENYTLLDTIVTETRGSAQYRGSLAGLGSEQFNIELSYANATLSNDGERVFIRPFVCTVGRPLEVKHIVPSTGASGSFSTDAVLHDGQKLVLGKIHMNTSLPVVDIFVVLTVKIIENAPARWVQVPAKK